MKKIVLNFFLVIALSISPKAWADEGFWLPLLIERLNYVDMQKMGCHLTAEEIYSVNNSSLKDAIVLFNYNECSGEMISSEIASFNKSLCQDNPWGTWIFLF